MAGLEPARANYGPTDFKSVASTIPPHRLFSRAEAKFPREAAIPYNLACYYCQLGEMEKNKRYLKEAFEIDLN